MQVIGVDTKKLTKTKTVPIVNFFISQSLQGSDMQMHSQRTSLLSPNEVSVKVRISAEILTAIKYTVPHTKSLHKIEVCILSAANVTRAMLANFNSMQGRGFGI